MFASDQRKYPKEKRMRNLSFVKRMTALAMALMFLVASNVTRVEAAPANNLTPEQIEAIVRNMYDNSLRSMLREPQTVLPLTARLKTRLGLRRYREHKPSLLISKCFPRSWMNSDSSRLTSRSAVRKLPSNGGYVLRPRPEMSSSWRASVS